MLGQTRQLEKALMLPLIILSLALMMGRLVQSDIIGIDSVALLIQQLIDYVPLFITLGLISVYSRDPGSSKIITGGVSYFSLLIMMTTIEPDAMSVYALGVVAAVIALISLNYCRRIRLPQWLGYFHHARLAPVIAAVLAAIVGAILGQLWPYIELLLGEVAQLFVNAGVFGLFIEGIMSRLLVPFGLHYVMEGAYWQHLIFPVVTFALPMVMVAMYKATQSERKIELLGLFVLLGACALLTGNADAIEIVLLITSPLLFLVHALLTGVVLTIAITIGGFSAAHGPAGLIDFVMYSYELTNPKLFFIFSVVIGIAYGFIFYILIKHFSLQEEWANLIEHEDSPPLAEPKKIKRVKEKLFKESVQPKQDLKSMAEQCLVALGGMNNLEEFDACITRIRMSLKDRRLIDEKALRRLGVKGVVKLGENHLQVIFGPVAENLAVEMKQCLNQHQDQKNG